MDKIKLTPLSTKVQGDLSEKKNEFSTERLNETTQFRISIVCSISKPRVANKSDFRSFQSLSRSAVQPFTRHE